jgi:hypothetical protein
MRRPRDTSIPSDMGNIVPNPHTRFKRIPHPPPYAWTHDPLECSVYCQNNVFLGVPSQIMMP